MMMRPRLPRTFSFALLAVLIALTLAYFPFSKIRAANTATILPSAGKPLVNLKSVLSPNLTYAGDGAAAAALKGGAAMPTALAAADFNHDGAMDIVAGYSSKGGGALAIFHGNPDAFAPADQTLYGKAIVQGKVPPTFLPKASAFSLPESPDLIATADFNGDGNKDVLVAARGSSNLYLLPGDGTGNLLAAQTIPLLGQVRAFAATDDGHLAVSIDGANASELSIFAPGAAGFTTLATYPLPASGTSVAWGSLGGGLDVAVGAGSNVVLVYSPLSAKAQSETVTVPFQVQGLAVGNFIWDRDGRNEISVLADDGSIHILQHGTLNTTAVTAAELPARRAAIRGKKTAAQKAALKAQQPNPTALGPWTLAKQLPYTGSAPSGPVSSSAFNSPRLASSATHDLMVVDSAASQLHILDTSGQAASPSADVSFANPPVAALAMPQKLNSDRDIVVLTSSQATPLLVTSGATLTLNVTTTADTDPNNNCTTSSTSVPNPLGLRAAVCIANNTGETATINIPAGTYTLTGLDSGELQQGVTGTGGNVSYSLTINGTGTAADTIIQGNTSGDRILEEDFNLQGNNPVVLENLTLQNATCSNNSTEDCTDGGGAVIGGSIAGDDLTLTNVVLNNNQANPTGGSSGGGPDNGGAVSFETPSNLTITSSTFSNNVASGAGGAVMFLGNGAGVLTITGSTFSDNTSGKNESGEPGSEGGGVDVDYQAGTLTTGSISGSTFTGNNSIGLGGGGGLFISGGNFTVSGSLFSGNTASGSGGGVSVDDNSTVTITENWWGCNGGPNASGCDAVAGVSSSDYTPWLVLSISANPTSVEINNTSTLTANLATNSSGGTGFNVPNGTAVTFGGTLDSSVNPTSTTLTSGIATSTYTAGSTGGTGTGTATVDNQTVTVDISIGTPPAFTSANNTTFTVGTHGSFPVSASGTPSPTITQTAGSLPSGVTFTSGTGSGTLAGTPAAGTGGVYSGIQFEAANGYLPNATQTFTLTVDQAPSINSANATTFTYDTFGSFQVTSAAGTYPTATFSETGSLPNGVTLSTSGLLSGTPTQAGPFPITITAANGVSPNATQSFTLTVGKIATSINVTSVSPSSEAYGLDSTVTITAVLSWTGSGATPTASDVTIGGNGPSTYSGTICGAPGGDTLTCTATYTPSASDTVASYTESATFSGDSNYIGSSSSQTNNFSITQASSTTSVASSQNPSSVGQSVTFTATINGEYGEIKGHNGAVVGKVNVIKKGAVLRGSTENGKAHSQSIGGTVTWSANTGCSPSTVSGDPGTAQCTTTTLPQGTDTITATYGGDTNHSGSVGTLAGGQVVNAVITPTSINVTSVSPSSEVYGQDSTVTITAVLSWTGSGPAPTASDVSIGGTGPSGYSATSCGAPSGDTLTCTATYTPTAGDTVASYTESATFSGDSNYSGSSSPQTNNFSITQASSTTSVASSQNPSTYGQSVTFTATINGEYGEIKGHNGELLGRVSVIKRGTPQRALNQKAQSPPSPVGIGGTVTWSANTGCSPSSVSGNPGTAQCTTTTLPVGTDTITATYGGDTNHSGSVGTLAGGQVVNSAITSTSINVTSVSPSSEVYGQDSTVTITAVLSWTGSGPAPTASDVSIGGTGPSGYSGTTCGAPSGDTLTCTATYTPTASDTVASYTESATFSGDSNYSGSSSPQTNNFSITQASSTTSVASSQNPSTVGQSVTFTATINGEYGEIKGHNGAVLGKVNVIKRGSALRGLTENGKAHSGQSIGGTVTWSANTGCSPSTVSGDPGTAQCTTTILPQGTDTITATYSGDTNHTGSTGTLSGGQVVNPAITSTSINVTSVNPSSEAYGQDATVTITAVLSWTGSGPAPTASDVSIGGTGPSAYSATSCGSPVSDTLTCTATYTPTASDTVGTYTESATFSGDSNYSGSSSPQTNNFSITQASSTTSVASSQNPSTVGESVTFTATIDGQYGLITKGNGVMLSRKGQIQKGLAHPLTSAGISGTVTWSANTGCSPSTVSGDPGTAQCTTTILPQGTDTITATYSGDTNHTGSTGTLAGGQVVNGQAEISVTPSSINFGTDYLYEIKDQNVTVKNIGTTSVTINSVTVTLGSGTNKGDFTALNLCPKTLAAGKSCLINVVFFAGNIGSLSATVDVNDSATGSPQTVSLSATVINPIASYNPSSLNFGTVQVGQSLTKDVTLTNKGTTALDISSVSITGADEADYKAGNGCPSSLNPGADCVISVTFTPSKTGTRTANLTVVDNAAIGTQYVPLTGKGSSN